MAHSYKFAIRFDRLMMLKTGANHTKLFELLEYLKKLDSVCICKRLQGEIMSMTGVRVLFDQVADVYVKPLVPKRKIESKVKLTAAEAHRCRDSWLTVLQAAAR
ncbi:hypothetical protein PF010_g3633 [Phytophthora fragariae]|uniref:Uncharacterized protein n=2 Tax=Phytophthora fragariae TaxID=53985 RepID=A0A6A3FVM2_9STRA|nr:hypothetical protein PF009_g2245 [Phytophthora fragariae]KAE9024413.1 hypothetical protein PF011_g3525 [Phytophthora fragariae]KAE9129663.1 hypothetical protein PF007_g4812 [Phytophthora fragariae]KAE9131058.1 hypothetical protein PF010_g3633 [Phytophthora fragariae]KAE9147229.1 hypothetical protein PF006_g8075 [Phytophthora fragariae]